MTSTTISYGIQQTLVDRPESGVRTGWLRCATCGNSVGLRILSAELTRVRKRRELLVLLLSLIPGAGFAVGFALSLPDPGALTIALLISGLLLLSAAGQAAHMLVTEQGAGIAKGRGNGWWHRTQPYRFFGAGTVKGLEDLHRDREDTPTPFIDDEF
ncbi:hypothetical protein DMB38_35985 [Streptomyces sp. WAC 06738]|uniref:hypothetical protein n=1 Tax=Streptomyces sp. WAC 06738 TaxID=2203210 RepID=UPI000F6E58A7|nr:hypothetical protein [Streptomyces sp. WAC 06738]AZM50475.1 hypothetical protein DMB38_35985 [Streptomyces sp. WAC 06738]